MAACNQYGIVNRDVPDGIFDSKYSKPHNALLNLEELDQGELDGIRTDYLRLAKEARETLKENSSGTPEVPQPGNRGNL
jgi:hypothetical protein